MMMRMGQIHGRIGRSADISRGRSVACEAVRVGAPRDGRTHLGPVSYSRRTVPEAAASCLRGDVNRWPESDSPGAWRSADRGALARPANGCGPEAVSQGARTALTTRRMFVYPWATGQGAASADLPVVLRARDVLSRTGG
jgi:hypothetical protein